MATVTSRPGTHPDVTIRNVVPGQPDSSDSFLKQLKRETATQHAGLEQRLNLLRPDLTSACYCDLLSRFCHIYSSWEPLSARLLSSEFPLWSVTRSRLPLIHQDLSHFGLPVPAAERVPFPGIDSLASALGGMYVLEGSTLGSQILTRHFSATLGVSPERGGAFFHGYGDRTAAMWREFTQSVESWAARTLSHREAIEGARTMFDVVSHRLVGAAR